MAWKTRILLVLGVVVTAGVCALLAMANRYGGLLEERELSRRDPSVTAIRQVDAFVGVRRRLRLALDAGGSPPRVPAESELESMLSVREAALTAMGIDLDDYLRLREMYRNWKSGDPELSDEFRRAWERRRDRLVAIELGGYGSPDL